MFEYHQTYLLRIMLMVLYVFPCFFLTVYQNMSQPHTLKLIHYSENLNYLLYSLF